MGNRTEQIDSAATTAGKVRAKDETQASRQRRRERRNAAFAFGLMIFIILAYGISYWSSKSGYETGHADALAQISAAQNAVLDAELGNLPRMRTIDKIVLFDRPQGSVFGRIDYAEVVYLLREEGKHVFIFHPATGVSGWVLASQVRPDTLGTTQGTPDTTPGR